MKKIFYNSTQWGIQEKELNQIRSRGLEYLDKRGIKTTKHYFLSIKEAIKNTEELDRIFSQGRAFLILLEPADKKNKKIGRFNVTDKQTLYKMIKEIKPEEWNDYIISFIEQIKENGKEFVGTAISDGEGKLFIEFLIGTTNSKYLTSTGCDSSKIDSCCFIDFEEPIKFPKMIPFEVVESIKKDCHQYKGYYEFVYGRAGKDNDIYYTFYSDIDEYINLLKNFEGNYTHEAIESRLKYHYLKQKRYLEFVQDTKEHDER